MAKPEPLLATIGDVIDDVVVWLDEPLHYGTDTASRIVHRRGGSAANVAVFAPSQGVRSRFIGQVGADGTGDALLGELARAGVECAVTRGGTTGTIVVVVDESGERTMLTDRGAAPELAALPAGALAGVALLHVPAYSLLASPLASAVGAATRARDFELSIDTSSIEVLSSVGAGAIASLSPDIVFCGEAEFDVIGPAIAPTVIVKRGAADTWLFHRGMHHALSPPEVDVADTTGAGDALAAGFLAARLLGAAPLDALRSGQRLAALVLTQPGAALPPSLMSELGGPDARMPRSHPPRTGKRGGGAPRLPLFEPHELDGEQRALYDTINSGPRRAAHADLPAAVQLTDEHGRLRGPFNALLLKPGLGRAIQDLGRTLRFDSGLSDRAREIAILITAAHVQSDFEWAAHAAIATKLGLSASLGDIAAGGGDAFDDPIEAEVARLAHVLNRRADVTDDEYTSFDATIGAAGILEVNTLVGFYRMLAVQMRVFPVDSPPAPWSNR